LSIGREITRAEGTREIGTLAAKVYRLQEAEEEDRMSMQGPNGFSGKDQDDLAAMKGANQGWRYSMAFGVMYGNVPVGIIVVGIGLVIWFIVK
jgi:hypothetical protein